MHVPACRHFDSASYYASEHEVGDALFLALSNGQVRRSDLWITTKLWNSDHGNVVRALKRSLLVSKQAYICR